MLSSGSQECKQVPTKEIKMSLFNANIMLCFSPAHYGLYTEKPLVCRWCKYSLYCHQKNILKMHYYICTPLWLCLGIKDNEAKKEYQSCVIDQCPAVLVCFFFSHRIKDYHCLDWQGNREGETGTCLVLQENQNLSEFPTFRSLQV